VVYFAQTTEPNQIDDTRVVPNGESSVAVQIIRECRMRAAILTAIAKEAPELEIQLLYVAKEHLTLAIISEQLNAGTDRAPHKLPALH
jgi:hypothetical protein